MPFEHSMRAGGDIRPARFVKLDTSANMTVIEADANELIYGVSQLGGREAPIPSLSTVLAGALGDNIAVHGDGDICWLQVAQQVTPGQRLKSDADGKGVPIATGGDVNQNVGALVLTAAGTDALARVQVMRETNRPVASS